MPQSPYCNLSIISCGCSMRSPTAKDLASIGTRSLCSISKVSRALCPMARITIPLRISSPFAKTPVTRFSSVRRAVTCEPKRTSPPQSVICLRRCSTTWIRMSVPMWGFASYRISFGAPASTKMRRTSRIRPFGSLTVVVNFPSEKVPAPPSPNCTLEPGSNTPSLQNRSTSSCLLCTSFPRSRSRGRHPAFASIYPQKSPAGPVPTITGLPQDEGSCRIPAPKPALSSAGFVLLSSKRGFSGIGNRYGCSFTV